jgi:hypothetical protein
LDLHQRGLITHVDLQHLAHPKQVVVPVTRRDEIKLRPGLLPEENLVPRLICERRHAEIVAGIILKLAQCPHLLESDPEPFPAIRDFIDMST